MPEPLTPRHEVVPALDAGSSDSSSRGQCPGHGESRPEGLGEGTVLPSPPGPAAWGQDEGGWKGGGQGTAQGEEWGCPGSAGRGGRGDR